MNITVSKISPINYKNYSASCPVAKSQKCKNGDLLSFLSAVAIQQRTELEAKELSEEVFFQNFLKSEGKVSREEYEYIKKNHPKIIKKAKDYCETHYTGDTTPQIMAYITLKTDKHLKEKYKNYRIISLGTSPSPLTEQLANLGHEVIFLPVSGFMGCEYIINSAKSTKEMQALMEYLKSKITDNKKVNIILDYYGTGCTLENMTENIKKYLSLKNRNIIKMPLQDLLKDVYRESRRLFAKDRYTLRAQEAKPYETDMNGSKAERISNVPHFPVLQTQVSVYRKTKNETSVFVDDVSSLQKLYDKFEKFSKPLARAFSLSTMAEVDTLTNFEY